MTEQRAGTRAAEGRRGCPWPVAAAAVLAVGVVAAAGSSYAAVRITGADVRNGSLTGRDLRTDSVPGSDIRDGTLGRRDLPMRLASTSPGGSSDVPGDVVLGTVEVRAPRDGWLALHGEVGMNLPATDIGSCSLVVDGAVGDAERAVTAGSVQSLLTCSVSGVVPVTKGRHVVELSSFVAAGGLRYDPFVSAEFVPYDGQGRSPSR